MVGWVGWWAGRVVGTLRTQVLDSDCGGSNIVSVTYVNYGILFG